LEAVNSSTEKSSVINQLLYLDARELKTRFTDSSNRDITCTITSPPYYDLYDYGGTENQIGFGQGYEEYLKDVSDIFQDIYSISSDKGSLWIIIDTFSKNKELVPLPFDLVRAIGERRAENAGQGWTLKSVFMWKKDKTRPWVRKGHFRKIFEYILYFVKTEDFNFFRDRVRIKDTAEFKQWWVKYPERYNPLGIIPTNLWEYPIPVQGSWGGVSLNHYCPLPTDMIKRMILLSTNENDIVCDPFAGTGSVLITASMENRNYIGCEINQEYIDNFENITKEQKDNTKKLEEEREKETQLEKELFNKIVDLRILKYSKALFLKIRKEQINPEVFKDINSIFIRKYPILLDLENNPYGAQFYGHSSTYFVFNSKHEVDLQKINDLKSKRGLRKYQIDSKVICIDKESMIEKADNFNSLYLYRSPTFFSYEYKISFEEWIEKSSKLEWSKLYPSKTPPLLSNIKRKITPKSTYKSKKENLQRKINDFNGLI
jgi:DNA modification methylase